MDDQLPSNIIFEIFSRVPVKTLVRFRCVSEQWRQYIDDSYLRIIHHELDVEQPTPIMFHEIENYNVIRPYTLYVNQLIHFNQSNIHDHYVLKRKGAALIKSSVRVRVRGSCNGLLYFSQEFDANKLFVIHPQRREYYKLPLMPHPLSLKMTEIGESCGLGFDGSAENFKMCVPVKNLCTMVHVFGTNSWREIPKFTSYNVSGQGIFGNGCLHWLVNYFDKPTREVIWFDVTKEEFGLINTPKTIAIRKYNDHLVDIAGEVGLVCDNPICKIQIWILKQKEWVLHCLFEKKYLPKERIKVLGCWNKEGDLLISVAEIGKQRFFVYRLKKWRF